MNIAKIWKDSNQVTILDYFRGAWVRVKKEEFLGFHYKCFFFTQLHSLTYYNEHLLNLWFRKSNNCMHVYLYTYIILHIYGIYSIHIYIYPWKYAKKQYLCVCGEILRQIETHREKFLLLNLIYIHRFCKNNHNKGLYFCKLKVPGIL